MGNQANGSSPTQERSAVRNTLEKEKNQERGEHHPGPLSHEAIREFCDKHYDQLLPLMSESFREERLRQVKTRLDFDDEEPKNSRSQSRHSESRSLDEKVKKKRKASSSTRSGPSEYSYS